MSTTFQPPDTNDQDDHSSHTHTPNLTSSLTNDEQPLQSSPSDYTNIVKSNEIPLASMSSIPSIDEHEPTTTSNDKLQDDSKDINPVPEIEPMQQSEASIMDNEAQSSEIQTESSNIEEKDLTSIENTILVDTTHKPIEPVPTSQDVDETKQDIITATVAPIEDATQHQPDNQDELVPESFGHKSQDQLPVDPSNQGQEQSSETVPNIEQGPVSTENPTSMDIDETKHDTITTTVVPVEEITQHQPDNQSEPVPELSENKSELQLPIDSSDKGQEQSLETMPDIGQGPENTENTTSMDTNDSPEEAISTSQDVDESKQDTIIATTTTHITPVEEDMQHQPDNQNEPIAESSTHELEDQLPVDPSNQGIEQGSTSIQNTTSMDTNDNPEEAASESQDADESKQDATNTTAIPLKEGAHHHPDNQDESVSELSENKSEGQLPVDPSNLGQEKSSETMPSIEQGSTSIDTTALVDTNDKPVETVLTSQDVDETEQDTITTVTSVEKGTQHQPSIQDEPVPVLSENKFEDQLQVEPTDQGQEQVPESMPNLEQDSESIDNTTSTNTNDNLKETVTTNQNTDETKQDTITTSVTSVEKVIQHQPDSQDEPVPELSENKSEDQLPVDSSDQGQEQISETMPSIGAQNEASEEPTQSEHVEQDVAHTDDIEATKTTDENVVESTEEDCINEDNLENSSTMDIKSIEQASENEPESTTAPESSKLDQEEQLEAQPSNEETEPIPANFSSTDDEQKGTADASVEPITTNEDIPEESDPQSVEAIDDNVTNTINVEQTTENNTAEAPTVASKHDVPDTNDEPEPQVEEAAEPSCTDTKDQPSESPDNTEKEAVMTSVPSTTEEIYDASDEPVEPLPGASISEEKNPEPITSTKADEPVESPPLENISEERDIEPVPSAKVDADESAESSPPENISEEKDIELVSSAKVNAAESAESSPPENISEEKDIEIVSSAKGVDPVTSPSPEDTSEDNNTKPVPSSKSDNTDETAEPALPQNISEEENPEPIMPTKADEPVESPPLKVISADNNAKPVTPTKADDADEPVENSPLENISEEKDIEPVQSAKGNTNESTKSTSAENGSEEKDNGPITSVKDDEAASDDGIKTQEDAMDNKPITDSTDVNQDASNVFQEASDAKLESEQSEQPEADPETCQSSEEREQEDPIETPVEIHPSEGDIDVTPLASAQDHDTEESMEKPAEGVSEFQTTALPEASLTTKEDQPTTDSSSPPTDVGPTGHPCDTDGQDRPTEILEESKPATEDDHEGDEADPIGGADENEAFGTVQHVTDEEIITDNSVMKAEDIGNVPTMQQTEEIELSNAEQQGQAAGDPLTEEEQSFLAPESSVMRHCDDMSQSPVESSHITDEPKNSSIPRIVSTESHTTETPNEEDSTGKIAIVASTLAVEDPSENKETCTGVITDDSLVLPSSDTKVEEEAIGDMSTADSANPTEHSVNLSETESSSVPVSSAAFESEPNTLEENKGESVEVKDPQVSVQTEQNQIPKMTEEASDDAAKSETPEANLPATTSTNVSPVVSNNETKNEATTDTIPVDTLHSNKDTPEDADTNVPATIEDHTEVAVPDHQGADESPIDAPDMKTVSNEQVGPQIKEINLPHTADHVVNSEIEDRPTNDLIIEEQASANISMSEDEKTYLPEDKEDLIEETHSHSLGVDEEVATDDTVNLDASAKENIEIAVSSNETKTQVSDDRTLESVMVLHEDGSTKSEANPELMAEHEDEDTPFDDETENETTPDVVNPAVTNEENLETAASDSRMDEEIIANTTEGESFIENTTVQEEPVSASVDMEAAVSNEDSHDVGDAADPAELMNVSGINNDDDIPCDEDEDSPEVTTPTDNDEINIPVKAEQDHSNTISSYEETPSTQQEIADSDPNIVDAGANPSPSEDKDEIFVDNQQTEKATKDDQEQTLAETMSDEEELIPCAHDESDVNKQVEDNFPVEIPDEQEVEFVEKLPAETGSPAENDQGYTNSDLPTASDVDLAAKEEGATSLSEIEVVPDTAAATDDIMENLQVDSSVQTPSFPKVEHVEDSLQTENLLLSDLVPKNEEISVSHEASSLVLTSPVDDEKMSSEQGQSQIATPSASVAERACGVSFGDESAAAPVQNVTESTSKIITVPAIPPTKSRDDESTECTNETALTVQVCSPEEADEAQASCSNPPSVPMIQQENESISRSVPTMEESMHTPSPPSAPQLSTVEAQNVTPSRSYTDDSPATPELPKSSAMLNTPSEKFFTPRTGLPGETPTSARSTTSQTLSSRRATTPMSSTPRYARPTIASQMRQVERTAPQPTSPKSTNKTKKFVPTKPRSPRLSYSTHFSFSEGASASKDNEQKENRQTDSQTMSTPSSLISSGFPRSPKVLRRQNTAPSSRSAPPLEIEKPKPFTPNPRPEYLSHHDAPPVKHTAKSQAFMDRLNSPQLKPRSPSISFKPMERTIQKPFDLKSYAMHQEYLAKAQFLIEQREKEERERRKFSPNVHNTKMYEGPLFVPKKGQTRLTEPVDLLPHAKERSERTLAFEAAQRARIAEIERLEMLAEQEREKLEDEKFKAEWEPFKFKPRAVPRSHIHPDIEPRLRRSSTTPEKQTASSPVQVKTSGQKKAVTPPTTPVLTQSETQEIKEESRKPPIDLHLARKLEEQAADHGGSSQDENESIDSRGSRSSSGFIKGLRKSLSPLLGTSSTS